MSTKVNKRAEWTTEMIGKAMDMVKEGYSQRQAAVLNGIPRRTLRNHIKSNSSVRKIGRDAILSPEQETDLVKRIIHFAERGLPLTPLSVRRCVYQYCELHSIPHPFSRTRKCAGMFCYEIVIAFCFRYLSMNSSCRSEVV